MSICSKLKIIFLTTVIGVLYFTSLCHSVLAQSYNSPTNFYLKITNDRDDDKFYPGDRIRVRIAKKNPMGQEKLAKVWYIIGVVEFAKTEAPFDLNYTVLDDEIGRLKFYVLLKQSNGRRIEIEDEIWVELKERLLEIKLLYPDWNVILEGLARTHQIHVRGIFDDGENRSITYSEYGTTYHSLNEDIVTVTKDGFVTARNYGETEIVVTNGGFEVRSNLRVIPQ